MVMSTTLVTIAIAAVATLGIAFPAYSHFRRGGPVKPAAWNVRSVNNLSTAEDLLDLLEAHGTTERVLVIHGNYLVQDEINFLAAHRDRMSLVYCPRTHAYFSHEPYPLAEMIKAGVRVAVGTDSRASNPDLKLV